MDDEEEKEEEKWFGCRCNEKKKDAWEKVIGNNYHKKRRRNTKLKWKKMNTLAQSTQNEETKHEINC